MPNNGTPHNDAPVLQPSLQLTDISMSVGHVPGKTERMLVIDMSMTLALPLDANAARELAKKLTGGIEIHTTFDPSRPPL